MLVRVGAERVMVAGFKLDVLFHCSQFRFCVLLRSRNGLSNGCFLLTSVLSPYVYSDRFQLMRDLLSVSVTIFRLCSF
jgi:hypothetical protein